MLLLITILLFVILILTLIIIRITTINTGPSQDSIDRQSYHDCDKEMEEYEKWLDEQP